MAITLKEAVAKATTFALETLGEERTKDFRIEEVESTTSESGAPAWRITVSMRGSRPPDEIAPASLADIAHLFGARREYKTFTVLKDNGEVESMRIRELA